MTSRVSRFSSCVRQLTVVGLICGLTLVLDSEVAESQPTIAPEALSLAQSLQQNTPEKRAAEAKRQPKNDTIDPKAVKPEVSFLPLADLSSDDWLVYAELEANAFPLQLAQQTVYVNPVAETVTAVWKNNDQLVLATYPVAEPIRSNPYLLRLVTENPSDLKVDRPLLIDLAPIADEEKMRLKSHYLAARVAIPFLLTDPGDGSQLIKIVADDEPGKYEAQYLTAGAETAVTVYHLITYKEGKYGHINPDDIFGNDEVTIDGIDVFKDEASLYWRSNNLIYDFPASAYRPDQPHALISAFLKQFPPGGY